MAQLTPITPDLRDEVLAALSRIEASPSFRGSRQARDLLRYLVEKCLAGEAAQLKGYTIGTEALGRPEDFDPVADTAVRVAMRRLRKLLADYHAAEGAGDALQLHLGPGDYEPRLIRAAAPPPPAPPPPRRLRRAPLVLLALIATGAAFLALRPVREAPVEESEVLELGLAAGGVIRQTEPRGLPEAAPTLTAPVIRLAPLRPVMEGEAALAVALSTELRIGVARFTEMTVLDAAEGAADYAIGGVVSPGGRFLVELRRIADSRVMAVFEGTADLPGTADAMRFISTALAQPYGLILSAERRRQPPGPPRPGFGCVLALMDHWRQPDLARFAEVRRCMAETVAAPPAAGPKAAAQVLTLLETWRQDASAPAGTLAAAYVAARLAARDHPYDPRVQQALGAVLYSRGDTEAAISALRNARRYNPQDPNIAADLAARLIGAGQLPEARLLLREACHFVATRPAWMDFYMFLVELLAGDRDRARDRAGRMLEDDFMLNLAARAIAARMDGDAAGFAALQARLVARDPAWATEPAKVLARRIPSERVVDAIAAWFGETVPVLAPMEPVPGPAGCAGDRPAGGQVTPRSP